MCVCVWVGVGMILLRAVPFKSVVGGGGGEERKVIKKSTPPPHPARNHIYSNGIN